MRILFFLVISIVMASALSINESMLKIHASLVPKLFLLKHHYKNSIVDNTIVISIVYNATDYKSATYLKNAINTKYSTLNSYKLKVILIKYSDISKCQKNTNVLYMLPASSKDIRYAVEVALKCKALTFCYKQNDLKHNAMISIDIGKKVKPILNLEAISESNLSFKPVLLSISKIYVNKLK